MAANPVPDILAAVDLGSNSFHMVVARYNPRPESSSWTACVKWCVWARALRKTAASTRTSPARAFACLERFGQRLRDMHADSVRVVGTNALRRARPQAGIPGTCPRGLGTSDRNHFGHGRGTPHLFRAVAHTVPTEPGRRLVCDIGGGSTELIIGEGNEPLELESLQMGCVSLSERFFSDGKLSPKRLNSARVAARLELEPIQAAYRRRGWQTSYGSSGTVRAIGDVVRELDPAAKGITVAGLEKVLSAHRRGRACARTAALHAHAKIAVRCFPAASHPDGSVECP